MKKINKLIKILLVLCLTITQFIPLINVSAMEEVPSVVNIIEKTDNNLYVQYKNSNNYPDGEYKLIFHGSYTYLNNETIVFPLKSITVNKEGINNAEFILPMYNFDGTYSIKIELYQGEDKIDETIYYETVEHPFGLETIVSPNVVGDELNIGLSDKNVTVTNKVLSGKLAPNETYIIPIDNGNIEILGSELANKTLNDLYGQYYVGYGNVDYSNYLYSTYNYEYSLNLIAKSTNEELSLKKSLTLKYGEMTDNDNYLNNNNKISAIFKDDIVTLKAYTGTTIEESKLTIQNLIDDIKNNVYIDRNYEYKVFDAEGNLITDYAQLINNDMVVKISYMGVVLSYKVSFENDYNKDTYFNELDLLPAIENFVNGDKEIDKDVEETTNIIEGLNNNWNNQVEELNPIVSLNGTDTINVNDEVTLTYDIDNIDDNIVNAFGGIINYDSEKLELISITSNDNWIGKVNLTNNKVLFASTSGSSNGTLLTIKFKAITEGSAEVSLSNVSLAFNNKSSNLVNYSLSKTVNILTNNGVGGSDVVTTLTNNESEDTSEVVITKQEEVTEELTAIDEEKTESKEKTKSDEDEVESQNTVSRVVIVILIVLVIAGLVYLIFKDDEEENEETVKTNNKTKKK